MYTEIVHLKKRKGHARIITLEELYIINIMYFVFHN